MIENREHSTSEELVAAAAKQGVEVTISTAPAGVSGEAMFFPGVRATSDERRADLLRDDSGDGTVE